MKKAFSLFEILIVILIVSIISTYLFIKVNSSIEFSNKTKVKSDIAQIRNSLSKLKTSNILLNKQEILKLDDASVNQEQSELFTEILENPFISTNTSKKEISKWIKLSSSKYIIYYSSEKSIEFEFYENSFNCISGINLCKEFE